MHYTTRNGHGRFTLRAIAAALLLGTATGAQEPDPAGIGEPVPEHEFTRLIGHDGRTKLGELYGHPVLLAGWRRHIGEGLHSASLADMLFREYGDDGLLVVLQDREKWSGKPPWVEDVDFWYRFYGTPFWITESVEGENDPAIVRKTSAIDSRSLVLIGVDGRLLLETWVDLNDDDHYEQLEKDIKQKIKEETRKRKKGWGKDPIARKARSLAFGKGNLASALKALDGVKEEDRVPEHDVVRQEVARIFDARVKGLEFLFEEARFLDAKQALKELAAAVKGRPSLADQLAPLTQRLESDEVQTALKVDKKLARVLAPFTERELDDLDLDFIRKLRAFAAKHEGSPVGERARKLDPLLSRIVRILRRIPSKEFEDRVRDD